jgi:O-antigen ligase
VASRAREAAAPVYLFACLLLGGSAQGIWANMVLQLAGVGLIAWAALTPADEPLTRPARQLLGLAILGLALIVLQLVPLPPPVWSHLPGREPIAAGYRLLGINVPAMPLSLTPYQTFGTFLSLIPPIAMLCLLIRMGASRSAWLVTALLLGTFAGILLGALQVTSGDPLHSPWYLYERTNFGVATGFFANANHMANLLVVCLPFLAALVAAARGGEVQRYSAVAALVAGAVVMLVIGIVLNGSLAGYALALPVLLASAMLVIPAGSAARRWTGILSVLLLVAAVGTLWMRPVGSNFSAQATTSVTSREQMFSTTVAATREFLPLGSGVGSFRRVYPLFENADTIVPTIVNHAHNDYVELALETGIPGLALIALFLIWWAGAVWRAWRSPDAGHYARAASIASAAILVHSIVDYPLRTAAISTIFAMCLGLLVQRPAPARAEKSDLRPTRHLAFE